MTRNFEYLNFRAKFSYVVTSCGVLDVSNMLVDSYACHQVSMAFVLCPLKPDDDTCPFTFSYRSEQRLQSFNIILAVRQRFLAFLPFSFNSSG